MTQKDTQEGGLSEVIRLIHFAAFESDDERVALELKRLDFMLSRSIARPHLGLLRFMDSVRRLLN